MKPASAAAMRSPRVRWIQAQATSILTMDFSGATASETLLMLEDFTRELKAQPDESVRILTNVTEIQFDPAVSNKWKAAHVELHAKMLGSAIYGVSGLVGVAIRSYNALMLFLRLPGAAQKIRVFSTREEALAWLLEL